MQDYGRTSPRVPGGGANGAGAPHATQGFSNVRPLPTPQGWGGGSGVTSPQMGVSGFVQHPGGSSSSRGGYASEDRRGDASQQGSYQDGFAFAGGYRRESSSGQQQRPHSPHASNQHQQHSSYASSSSYPTYPSTSMSPPPPSRSPASPLSQGSSVSPHVQQHSFSQSQRPPLPSDALLMATTDHDSFVRVPLARLTSPAAVRESIMGKLRIGDDEMSGFELVLTSFGDDDEEGGGQGQAKKVLGDEELWDAARQKGVAVWARLRGGASSSFGGSSRDDDFESGMSAERLRQKGREQRRERERAEREREGSATSSSGPAGMTNPNPVHSATAPVGGHPRRSKSPSISSRSDISSHREGGADAVNEFGERQLSPASGGSGGSGLRSDRPSWTWSHGQRGDGHARRPSASASGALSPSIPSGSRDRAGSITPTAPSPALDGGRHDGEWSHSPPLASAGSGPGQSFSTLRSASAAPHPPPPASLGGQQVVMGPSGPTRRLPPQPQPHQQQQQQQQPASQSWSRATIPPAVNAPASLVNTLPRLSSHPPPPHHPQPPPIITRPLPPNDPRSSLPQYQTYVSGHAPQAPQMFHNLALQGTAYQPYSNGAPQHLGVNPDRSVLPARSADNLRGHYSQAFDGDLRPPVPPHPPSSYRGGSRPYPPPPTQQAQHQSSFPPVFDPRVMTVPLTPQSAGGSSSGSGSYYRSPSVSASNSYAQNQPPSLSTNSSASSTSTARPSQNLSSPYGPINGPAPGQLWSTVPSSSSTPQPSQRRPSDHSPWLPQQSFHQQPQQYYGQHQQTPALPPRPPPVDTSRPINLQPGETLQSATSTSRNRRPSDAPASGASTPGPAAAHMRVSDPANALDGFGIHADSSGVGDRYGAVTEMRREGSGGVPRSLRTGGRTSGGRERERDSGSSFASSASSAARDQRDEQRSSTSSSSSALRRATPAPSAPPAEEEPYTGMRDDEAVFYSAQPHRPPQPSTSTSTLSSTDRRTSRFTSPPSSARSSASGPLTPADGAPPTTSISVQPRSSVELDDFGDPIEDDSATWFPVNQPAKAPAVGEICKSEAEKDTSTARAHEWAQAVIDRMGGSTNGEDGEQTLTRTLQPGTADDKKVTASGDDDDDESKFADVDEFGDDPADDSTYFAGFGPARPSFSTTSSSDPAPTLTTSAPSGTTSPTLQGISLHDEPSSRSPVSDRNKRPNLRLKIETPPASSDSHSSSTSATGRTSADPSPPTSSGPSSSGNLRRAAAAGEPGDLASYMSTRRAERVERIRANATSKQQDSLMALGHPGSHSPNGGMARRNSFRAREEDDQDWAIRPAVETVLENLDVFFPDVDLDKPVFDLPTPAPSTPSPSRETGPSPPDATPSRSASTSTVHPAVPALASSPAPPIHPARRAISSSGALPGATGLSHKKSIRVVAQDRKRAMQKAGRNVVTAVSGLGSNLLRRKSTKLFGARIEEVTSAQMGRISTTIREHPNDDPQNFSYKWIKGDLIGRGTFGHVYIGFSVNTGETIAVKQVELPKTQHDKDDARTKGMVQSLKAEIELLKDLDHPNIVLYLGMEQTPEHLSIFLEYVPGGSIGRIVRTHGKFEESIIKFFTYQILEGLEYLHSLGILHRDMKADNILTDQDGMCKISDFGTSKKSTDIYNNNENMSMQGSIFWMAPEVIHNKNMGYSAKADIWSLGCILIEMFAGRRPWSDEEAIQAMFKLGAERLAPPVPSDVTLSDLAESFLDECLQIDADLRPKAFQLQNHRFLQLEEGWSFTQTSLYRHMASEDERRKSSSTRRSG